MNAGIYCIENILNKKIYIGQSKYIKQRLLVHKNLLAIGKHHNIHLQNSYNKYGKKNFSFRILEKTDDIKSLNKTENKWIRHYKSFAGKNGYNIKYPTKVFRIAFSDIVSNKKHKDCIKSLIPKKIFPKKNCDFCNSIYQSNKTWQKFCSTECHDKFWSKIRYQSNDRFGIIKRLEKIEFRLGIK